MDKTDILGFLASLFTTFASIPQLIKIIKSKSAEDISLIMFVMTAIGLLLWFVYGVLIISWPLIISNAIAFSITCCIVYFKIKYNK